MLDKKTLSLVLGLFAIAVFFYFLSQVTNLKEMLSFPAFQTNTQNNQGHSSFSDLLETPTPTPENSLVETETPSPSPSPEDTPEVTPEE